MRKHEESMTNQIILAYTRLSEIDLPDGYRMDITMNVEMRHKRTVVELSAAVVEIPSH